MQALPDTREVREAAAATLSRNWREGRDRSGTRYAYTCPDPEKYPDQFFWDSCLHALAWSRIEPARAMAELRSLLSAQHPSGLVPHTRFWHGPVWWKRLVGYNVLRFSDPHTHTIQPPFLAWVWAEVARRAGDGAFADEGREALLRFHGWLEQDRLREDGLIGIIQPDESGLDATPAYDAALGWRAHPYPGFAMLIRYNRRRGFSHRRVVQDGGFHAADVLVNTGFALGWGGLARLGVAGARERARQTAEAIVRELWDPGAGFFFPRGPDGRPQRVATWAGLSPLALDDLPEGIGRRLVEEHLLDPRRFWTRFPVPSVSAAEPAFDPGAGGLLRRYWRGPTWLFAPWFIMRGLVRLGYRDAARDLSARVGALVLHEGCREYYNPHTGAGMGARSFGVSAMALECAMLAAEEA